MKYILKDQMSNLASENAEPDIFPETKRLYRSSYLQSKIINLMHPFYINIIKGNIHEIILLTLLMTVILIISSPLELRATRSAIDFYSLSSAPGGSGMLETLMAKWWNWWT